MTSLSSSDLRPPGSTQPGGEGKATPIRDTTSQTDWTKHIEEFEVMEARGCWTLFALTDGGNKACVYSVSKARDSNRGEVEASSKTYRAPTGPGPDGSYVITEAGVQTVPELDRLRCNALFRVRASEPLMTVDELTAFIVNSNMHDYIFGGQLHWISCLFGELEMVGRIPLGITATFTQYVKDRSDKLKLIPRREREPEKWYQILWPPARGIFRSAKLKYPWPE